ncbi:MAG: hypothetical protein ACTSVO_00760 [Candidatus Heimdallarchaeaceae archaeon]
MRIVIPSYPTSSRYIIEVNSAEGRIASQSHLPLNKISGSHLSCTYIIEPEDKSITVDGPSNDVDECKDHIIRAMCRNQDWAWEYSVRERGAMISITASYDEKEFPNLIIQEYRLPKYLELMFQESIFNYASGKLRISFLLMYSALERAIKLLYVEHCKITSDPGFYAVLEKLTKDPSVSLKVNLVKFDRNSNYRDIRNTIAHGRKSFENSSINLKVETKSLIDDVDDIFRQLSHLLMLHIKKL